jgi:hypothetical protein
MDPWIEAAKARAVVRLPDGRTGRLWYWPMDVTQRSSGRRHARMRAVVCLPSGAFVNADPAELQLQEAR